jgi:hypothetical protein
MCSLYRNDIHPKEDILNQRITEIYSVVVLLRGEDPQLLPDSPRFPTPSNPLTD